MVESGTLAAELIGIRPGKASADRSDVHKIQA